LVDLFAAAPWIFCAFNGIEVSVEPDFLRPHLDQNRSLGLVERFL
jgi:hypothetical protein